jgi:hypothetical protein
LLLGVAPHTILSVAGILFIYFLGFNILEASQPSALGGVSGGVLQEIEMARLHGSIAAQERVKRGL